MAVTINGFTITSLETIHAYNRQTGVCELYLDELQETTLDSTEDTQDITGKGDRLLKQIKKNKAVSVTGTSALICGDLMAAQTGSEVVSDEHTKVRKPEIIEVTKGAKTAKTAFKAVGETGAEIISIRELTANGALGKQYTQAAAASATEFTYEPSTQVITLPTDIAKNGDIKLVVFYDYEANGAKLVNKSDVFGKTLKVYIDCIGTDVCDNEYKCQFVIPRGQFSGEFSVTMGGDQTVEEFTINTLVDTCAGSNADLFEFIVYQD
nr:MAG TPA: putative structural protein [Caudoviricetes sp.]